MPKVNVYLPDDLAEAVREAGVPVSAVCQRALEQAVRRVTAVREATAGTLTADRLDPQTAQFTRRSVTMLRSAWDAARTAGLPDMGTEHLLAALAADENGLAARVLTALEITPQQVRAALAGRADGRPGAADGEAGSSAGRSADHGADVTTANGPSIRFSPQAAAAVQLAATESEATGLGHPYIGSEHLLLGLISEPDGAGGSVLRSLGAELRVTRRAVAAALAGWAAHGQAVTAGDRAGHEHPPLAAQVSAAVKAELAPVLARIERLERQAAG